MTKACQVLLFLLLDIFVIIVNINSILADEVEKTNENGKHFHFMFQDGFHYSSNVFVGFEQSSFMFDTPYAHSILKWNNMQGVQAGVELYVGYSRVRGYFKYTFSKLKSNRNATDDDITNNVYGFSIHDATGSSHDIRSGAEYDIFKNENNAISLRAGYMYKQLTDWEMNSLNMSALRPTIVDGIVTDISIYHSNSYNGSFNRANTHIHAMTVGLKLTRSFNKTVVGAIIFDFYPLISYLGKQNWSNIKYWSLTNNGYNNYGFMIRPEVDFQIYNHLFAKFYAYYEMLDVSKLNEQEEGGIYPRIVDGRMNYQSFGLGVAIGFSGI